MFFCFLFFLSFFVSPLSSPFFLLPFYLWPHELLHQIEIRDDTTNADEAVFKETDDLILMRHRVWCHCNAGWRKISWTVVWTSFFFEVLRHVRYYLFVLLWRDVFDHVFLAVFFIVWRNSALDRYSVINGPTATENGLRAALTFRVNEL